MVRFGSLLAAAFLASTVVVMTMPGCADQGEGERCDLNNGNADCASGLTCQTITGQPTTLCCPLPPAQPTVSECFAGQAVVPDAGADATTLPEAAADSEQEAATDDAADQDAAEDAAVDAAEEPAVDAPDEPAVDAPEEAAPDAQAD